MDESEMATGNKMNSLRREGVTNKADYLLSTINDIEKERKNCQKINATLKQTCFLFHSVVDLNTIEDFL